MASTIFPNKTISRTPKVHVTSGSIQPYIDPKEPSTRRSPWRQIHASPLIRSLTMTMSEEYYQQVWTKITKSTVTNSEVDYAKVIMNLENVLTGSFFNDYIRIGNILMIAEGVPGVDDIFTLQEGILRLELKKESYQRAGLQGQIVKNHGARKHVKERFLIELNLRSPSMVRGKKGFDRLLYAAKNVLNENKVWLFRDLMKKTSNMGTEDTGHDAKAVTTAAIGEHHPTLIRSGPSIDQVDEVIIPSVISFSNPKRQPLQVDDYEDLYEIVEWLDMVNIKSPRIQMNDNSDPYISRYVPPTDVGYDLHTDTINSSDESPASEQKDTTNASTSQNLKILRWTGLIDSNWIIQLIISMIKYSRSLNSKHWISISATAHETEALGQIKGYTILLRPDNTEENTTGLATLRNQLVSEPKFKPESELEPEKMEIDPTFNTQDVEKTVPSTSSLIPRPTADALPGSKAGLQHHICFQHVDS